ncbi:hypothetical protein CCH79_00020213 [Gambusia affinis]|uniref:Uncharacterized protein n=1 Tax=Gambusia affinis TaxID=33528 RepID=A0A315V7C5_GAMAF|nr:hypothetical protein CCH79_00020213 [Gambusia affinis]
MRALTLHQPDILLENHRKEESCFPVKGGGEVCEGGEDGGMRGGDEEEEDRELNARRVLSYSRLLEECWCLQLLSSFLLTFDLLAAGCKNPLQNHMRVQLPSTMSRKDGQLEGRLDDLLSRIAMETQEIKELEQQLTSNQILANEALQRDLQEATTGLQDYLRGLRQQARRSQQQVHVLQTENQSLRRLLQDSHRHCRMVQDPQQEELSALWTEVQALRVRQAELEAELQQLRAEPAHQVQLDQFYPTRLQLERLPDSLPEPKNQTEPQHGASSTDSLSAERVHGSAHQNRTGRQEVRPGQNQTVEQNLVSTSRVCPLIITDRDRTGPPNRSDYSELNSGSESQFSGFAVSLHAGPEPTQTMILKQEPLAVHANIRMNLRINSELLQNLSLQPLDGVRFTFSLDTGASSCTPGFHHLIRLRSTRGADCQCFVSNGAPFRDAVDLPVTI